MEDGCNRARVDLPVDERDIVAKQLLSACGCPCVEYIVADCART